MSISHYVAPSIVIGLIACAPAYAYVPDANANATVDGRAAADYPIPPEKPEGDVRIASFGFADLGDASAPNDALHAVRALHLRIVVANNSAKPWTLDTREQKLDMQGFGKSSPAFASADQGTRPPIITIDPAGKRVVDLFFPLPIDGQTAGKLPHFDALWRVHTDTQVVAERAEFDRIVLAPVRTAIDYGPSYWWAPPYWYDPLYPSTAFVGVAPIVSLSVGGPVVVRLHGEPAWR
jgi:hypothetical protein